jgi:steroid delta-isomerase-like uncharacterized protein
MIATAMKHEGGQTMIMNNGTGRVSRRVALHASGVGVAALALRETSAAYAQEATPSVGMAPRIVQEWIEAWNSDDPAQQLAALYMADAIYEDVPTSTSSQTAGTDVAGLVRSFVQQISDRDVRLRSAFGGDDHAAAEWDFSFTYTGQLPGLPPGTGQHVDWHGVTIFDLADGGARVANLRRSVRNAV